MLLSVALDAVVDKNDDSVETCQAASTDVTD